MPQLGIIGAAVAGAFTTVGAGFASTFTAIAIGAVTSAVVGAAIGGITAAVFGGDIGTGMLYGAIGGVVTGGLAGGSIVQSFGGAASPTVTFGGLGAESSTMAGATAYGEYSISGAAAANSGGAGLSSGLLSGGLGTGAGMIGQAAIGALAGGLQEDPELPYNQTEDYYNKQWAHEKDLQANAHTPSQQMPWQSTEEGVRYTVGTEYQMNKENNEARLDEIAKQYQLQREQTSHEFSLTRGVYDDAAKAASSGTYQSGSESAYTPRVKKDKTKDDGGIQVEQQGQEGGEATSMAPVEN